MLNLNKRSELTQRVIVGFLGGVGMIGAIYYGAWTYFALFLVISIATILEFYKLLRLEEHLPLRTYGTSLGILIYCLTFFIELDIISMKWMYLVFVGFTSAYLIKLYNKADKQPFKNLAYTFLGVMYCSVPFALIHTYVFFDTQYHYEILIGAMLILWANDSGAYFSGKTFGRRKLFERISPKKTWEGSIGGAALAVTVSLVFSHFYTSLEAWRWVTIAIIIVVTGTYGDLVESLFKRSMSIKDSGTTLPGHGGFLDRFDGLLLSAPFIAAFLRIFPPNF
ncbi:phosphatidate cytidylyltransferase [Flammeovirga yaeyamensis]|uniref:Phosphatidate cytidylyltransferase n=1 Tax=Flammeovirga yaeyamensis TaxID=367791 RepID=A0AAX1N4J5_9BACT|nr:MULTISPECIES: phosphatidate cytidylyltransferase [Flammeovirga]ANQ50078.1 phosphatidate cytidylyltransferase [Flammeovirga sp. MY04]MBB3700402.1 phosphatidate cytidylyltransferase [Flammeovirga yaeyamensis]NMF36972.1 phosphatidate cytidylyltransferase [Flammeovirga yaeyamensis]QWG02484.1 phosphatidate cytidylyltransferase [Flammeovirga yaeyamensis]